MATTYSTATIAADRGQRSFSLSLDQFLVKRGGSAIVARGRALKQSNAALFASIQQRFADFFKFIKQRIGLSQIVRIAELPN